MTYGGGSAAGHAALLRRKCCESLLLQATHPVTVTSIPKTGFSLGLGFAVLKAGSNRRTSNRRPRMIQTKPTSLDFLTIIIPPITEPKVPVRLITAKTKLTKRKLWSVGKNIPAAAARAATISTPIGNQALRLDDSIPDAFISIQILLLIRLGSKPNEMTRAG
jgi:hypothetical protein